MLVASQTSSWLFGVLQEDPVGCPPRTPCPRSQLAVAHPREGAQRGRRAVPSCAPTTRGKAAFSLLLPPPRCPPATRCIPWRRRAPDLVLNPCFPSREVSQKRLGILLPHIPGHCHILMSPVVSGVGAARGVRKGCCPHAWPRGRRGPQGSVVALGLS